MSDLGGTGGPAGSGAGEEAGPASPGDLPTGRRATVPDRPADLEKAAEVERPSYWRNLWRNLWRGPAGTRTAGADAGSSRPLGASDSPAIVGAGPLRLRVGVVSTVGNYREHNEDNFSSPSWSGKSMGGGTSGHRDASMEDRGKTGPIYPFVVADGMGGQLAGEKASQMAVDIIPKELSRRIGSGRVGGSPGHPARHPRRRRRREPGDPRPLGRSRPNSTTWGPPSSSPSSANDRVYIAGIGDSRAYRVRDGRIEQLTKDHSLAQALLEAGTITAEELPNHKFNHVLYLYLGQQGRPGRPRGRPDRPSSAPGIGSCWRPTA